MSQLLLDSLLKEDQPDRQPEAPSSLSPNAIPEFQQRLKEAREQDSKTKEQTDVEDAAWSSDDSLASAQRFFSSMALGWGDEMGLWTAAAVASVAEGKPIKEVYEDMRKTYDAKQEQFKERQPGAALASDIAGSVASPVNALRAAQAATKLGRGAQTVGRVATEGAVYGAGEAKEGERLSGAATGAGGGLAGYGVLRGATAGVGKAVSGVTSRKVEADLIDDSGDFVPITLAASKPDGVEGAIHTFYRDVISPSFGGKGVVKAQEKKIVGKAEDHYKAQKAMSKKMDEGIKKKTKENDEQIRLANAALEEERKALTEILNQEKNNVLLPLKEKLKVLNSGKAEEIVSRATDNFKKAAESRRFEFRNEAFSGSAPATASIDDINKIASLEDMGQRMRALDDLWRQKGYSMIKGKKIRVKKDEFEKKLSKGILGDEVFKVLLPDIGGFKKNVIDTITKMNAFKDRSNRIDGDALATIRGRLGTIAANAGDPQVKRAYYMVQGKIDDIIKKQLTPDQLKAFNKESGRWKQTIILRDSISDTQLKKRGYFDESDWLNSAQKNNNLDKRYGSGPLVASARGLQDTLLASEKAVARRSTALAKKKAATIEKTIADHTRKTEAEIERIDRNIKQKKARLSNNPSFSEEIGKDTLRKQRKEAEVEALKEQLAELKVLRSPQNPSWFHTLAATGILAGAATGGALGAGAGLAASVGLGRALATPTAQKIVAGQTAPQMGIQKLLQADATGRTADILSRGAGRVVGQGMLTGN